MNCISLADMKEPFEITDCMVFFIYMYFCIFTLKCSCILVLNIFYSIIIHCLLLGSSLS